ncbi:MAG: PqqD family protein [Methanobacterium sp.]|nr:PqqD family protein [Methanobacterium sp.]
MLNEYIALNNDKIAYRIIDGEAVIVDLKESKLNVLNPVATFILEHIDGQTQVKEIIEMISEEFDVDYGTAKKDCIDFISKLKDEKIVTLSPDTGDFK